jgi:hypothetical protein
MTHYTAVENVYVYFRTYDEETVMVVLNPNKNARELDLERFKENLEAYSIGRDVISDKEIEFDEKLQIQGNTAYILELK